MVHSKHASSYKLIPCLFIVCPLLILMTLSTSAGQLYTWVDEKGITHITDQPPDNPVKLIKQIPSKAIDEPVNVREKPVLKKEQNIDPLISTMIQKAEDDHQERVKKINQTYKERIAEIELETAKQIKEIQKMKKDIIDEYNRNKVK